MALSKYRLTKLPSSMMFSNNGLTYTEKGVLGWLSCQLDGLTYPVFTVLNVPLNGAVADIRQMLAILDRLVEAGWAEVVE